MQKTIQSAWKTIHNTFAVYSLEKALERALHNIRRWAGKDQPSVHLLIWSAISCRPPKLRKSKSFPTSEIRAAQIILKRHIAIYRNRLFQYWFCRDRKSKDKKYNKGTNWGPSEAEICICPCNVSMFANIIKMRRNTRNTPTIQKHSHENKYT